MTIVAAVLIAAVFGVVELVDATVPNSLLVSKNYSKFKVGIVFVIAEGMTFLVSATVWAHTQVIGGHPLDKLNVASKIVAGIFVAGAAAFGDRALGAVSNIGQNAPPKRPIAK